MIPVPGAAPEAPAAPQAPPTPADGQEGATAAGQETGTPCGRRTTFAGLVPAVDSAASSLFDRFRWNRTADWVALVLSNLADYGVVWVLVAAVKARRRGPRRRRSVLALGLAGLGSLGLNAAIKQVVRRRRPSLAEDAASDRRLPVRSPTSTSFPSGHTLAAFCTALALSEGPGETAAFVTFAAAVAASRVHLRAHHASDVVGGTVAGTALGLAVRRALRRPAR